jgi:hypothetical protein
MEPGTIGEDAPPPASSTLLSMAAFLAAILRPILRWLFQAAQQILPTHRRNLGLRDGGLEDATPMICAPSLAASTVPGCGFARRATKIVAPLPRRPATLQAHRDTYRLFKPAHANTATEPEHG